MPEAHVESRSRAWSLSGMTHGMQIMVYVDGRLVGETGVTEAPRHSVIGQLCELRSESPVAQSGMSHQALGFQLELPVLQTGVHEVSRQYAGQTTYIIYNTQPSVLLFMLEPRCCQHTNAAINLMTA